MSFPATQASLAIADTAEPAECTDDSSRNDDVQGDKQSLDAVTEANLAPTSGVLGLTSKEMTAESLSFSVLAHRLVQPFPVVPILCGFLPFTEQDSPNAVYQLETDDIIALRLVELTRSVPRTAIARCTQDLMKKAQEGSNRSLDASEINMIQGNAVVQLLKTALVQEQESLVLYQRSTGLIFISARGQPAGENARDRLDIFVPAISSSPWRNPEPLRLVMTTWLKTDQIPEGFTLGGKAKLTAPGGISTTINKQNLRTPQVLELIKQGQRVVELELVYQQSLSFTLCEKGFIKGIKLLQKTETRGLTGMVRAAARLSPYALTLFDGLSDLKIVCANTEIEDMADDTEEEDTA